MNLIDKFMNPEKELAELMAQLNAECSDIAEMVAHKMTIIGIDFLFVKITKSFDITLHNIDGRICISTFRVINNQSVWEQIDKTHGVSLTDYGFFIPADRQTKMRIVAYKYDILSALDEKQNEAIAELKEFFDC